MIYVGLALYLGIALAFAVWFRRDPSPDHIIDDGFTAFVFGCFWPVYPAVLALAGVAFVIHLGVDRLAGKQAKKH